MHYHIDIVVRAYLRHDIKLDAYVLIIILVKIVMFFFEKISLSIIWG